MSALQSFLDALPHGAAVLDERLALLAWNAPFARLAGISGGATGRSMREPLPGAITGLLAAAVGASKGRVEIVRAARFRDGPAERQVDATFAPFASADGEQRILMSLVDVTELEVLRAQLARRLADDRRLEEHVEERTREVIALQERHAHERRLAAVGQLASGVMHDVNNALNPIMAAAYLLEANAENPSAVRDYAARIAKAAEAGAASASRVGRFIRQEPRADPRGELVDLSAIAEEVVALTHPLWAERNSGGVVHFERDLTEGAVVRGVAGELREALLNLVQNALDAMPEGGRLLLRGTLSQDEVVVEVADSGVGMASDVRERAFDPFFSTKGAGGSGLGLAEVYGIVRRHRGQVEIDSDLGEGTTVRLRFPRERDGTVIEAEPPALARRLTVLVVEDHADGREFMRTILELQGHSVETVATVAEARELLALDDDAVEPPPFQVVVTDVGLPDGNGWALAAQLRARWPTVRLGVVTGWEPEMPEGVVCDFAMRKPVRPAELLAHIAAG